MDKAYWVNVLGLLFVILCLCSVFSEEIACRVDPIVRSSRFGTIRLSLAKLVVGEVIACMVLLLLFGITAAIQFGVHGIGGWKAPIQVQQDLYLFLRCGTLTYLHIIFQLS